MKTNNTGKDRGSRAARVAPQRRPASRVYLPVLLVASTAACVYANAVAHEFVFDDAMGIVNNPLVNGFHSFRDLLRILTQPWRPLTQLSHALTHAVAGMAPAAFHLVAVAVHVVNSVLVFGIAWMAAVLWLPEGVRRLFALAAGLLHAVHPIYTEAVAYVWGGSSAFCALFYFSSLLLVMTGYARPGRRRYFWYAGACLCWFFALGAKEEAVTLPFLVAAFFAVVRRWRAAALVLALPLIVAVTRWPVIVRLYREVGENQALVSVGSEPSLRPLVYFLTSVKEIVFHYLRLFLLPLGLNADPAVAAVTSPIDPYFLVSLTALAVAAVAGVLAWRKRPAVSFAVAALLLSPLTAYAFMPLADVVAEHRVYIAGLGFDLLLAFFLVQHRRAAPVALASLVLVFSVLTVSRNQVWANGITLWQDTASKSPGIPRPHVNLGMAYLTSGKADRALAEYNRALEMNPRLAAAHLSIGSIYYMKGDYERAEAALNKAVELSPSLPAPYVNLAAVALKKKEPQRALAYLDRAAALGDSYLVHLSRGDVLCQMGRYQEGVAEYNLALAGNQNLQDLQRRVSERLQKLRAAGHIR